MLSRETKIPRRSSMRFWLGSLVVLGGGVGAVQIAQAGEAAVSIALVVICVATLLVGTDQN